MAFMDEHNQLKLRLFCLVGDSSDADCEDGCCLKLGQKLAQHQLTRIIKYVFGSDLTRFYWKHAVSLIETIIKFKLFYTDHCEPNPNQLS